MTTLVIIAKVRSKSPFFNIKPIAYTEIGE